MQKSAIKIAEFLNPYKTDGYTHYKWPEKFKRLKDIFPEVVIPEISPAEKNIWLRNYLSEKLNTDNLYAKEEIARYFINIWGGISGFKQHTKIVTELDILSQSNNVPDEWNYKFDCISSWSKYLSILCPEWAVIYDARVVFSINTINYLYTNDALIFRSPVTRNKKLGIINVESLMIRKKISHIGSNIRIDDVRNFYIKDDTIFTVYCRLIREVSNIMFGNLEDIIKVEMLLFSLADNAVLDTLIKVIGSGENG